LGSGAVATQVVANNLSQSGFAASSGNAVNLVWKGQSWYRTYTAQNYTSSSNDSLFYSFLLRLDSLGSLNNTGGVFGGLASVSGGSGGAMIGLRASGAGYQIGIAKRDFSPLSFDSTVFSLGQTVLVVGSYNLVSGSVTNDTASLWINPGSLGQASVPTALATSSTADGDIQSFASFLWKPSATATQIPGSLIVDEIRVGNSWAEVTPIPEPTTWGLLILAAGGFLWMRKRRCA